MTAIPAHLVPSFDPIPQRNAGVTSGHYRVTVLTDRILRIEYSPDEVFEDRPSQAFWYRNTPEPEFTTGGDGDIVEVDTDYLALRIDNSNLPPTGNLRIEFKKSETNWRYGDPDTGNLLGTYRTLDTVDGSVPLEPGLLSEDGWVVVDDSKTLVFEEDGWLTPRPASVERLDLYFFGYGKDFRAALKDYRALTGPVPLLPRWALGNWWSRYWAYTDEELRELITDFESHGIPLSVCIIDMDWHITETGNESSGWTGYTWNRDLFPDPDATLRFIHEHGLKTALNLHPADGVYPHEAQYAAFAERMGMDPEEEKPIRFDLADPKFAKAYFELLHHPEEARGVDFWWIDWQQGTLSALPGLDPLWWLNHLHFFDSSIQRFSDSGSVRSLAGGAAESNGTGAGRNGPGRGHAGNGTGGSAELEPRSPQNQASRSSGGRDARTSGSPEDRPPGHHGSGRPFIFSRWGGLGNHRYPIGFSGDTVITWESLAFQPYFTSTAANVGYGWWSHDIGGHYGGSPEPELYARWVQYGVFSPILRLHSTNNPLLERRPFGWDAETERIATCALRLRHRLIPYIYTMARRDHAAGEAMIRPMYHDYPEERSAYFCPDQYTFGTELTAAPFVSRRDPETGLSRQVVWLPDAGWNFFTGERLQAGWHAVYGDMDDIPVYAKPGAIIPLCEPDDWRDPSALEVHVFPGASNEFQLYEDDGETAAYLDGDCRLTHFTVEWSEKALTFTIRPAANARTYALHFRGITEPESIEATLNGETAPAASEYDEAGRNLIVSPPDLGEGDAFTLVLEGAEEHHPDDADEIAALRKIMSAFNADNTRKQVLLEAAPRIVADPAWLAAYRVSFTDAQLRAILERLLGAGVHEIGHTLENRVIVWNRDGRAEVTYQLSTEHYRRWFTDEPFELKADRVPVFRGWLPAEDFKDVYWKMTFRWGDVASVELSGR